METTTKGWDGEETEARTKDRGELGPDPPEVWSVLYTDTPYTVHDIQHFTSQSEKLLLSSSFLYGISMLLYLNYHLHLPSRLSTIISAMATLHASCNVKYMHR